MATATAPPAGSAPRGHLLTGHLPELRRDALGFLTRCAREHGDVVPLRFGPKRVLLLSHPDDIEQVLVTESRHFGRSPGYRLMRHLLGDGLLTSDGDTWRGRRRLLQPAFHTTRVAAWGELMVDCARRLASTWLDGETRDIHREMMRLTLEIVAGALFGTDLASRGHEVHEALAVAREQFDARTRSLLFLLPMSLPTPGILRFRRAARRLGRVVDGIVEQRRASGAARDDLLALLLRAQEGDGDAHLTGAQVRDEVTTFLLAGHETTALALSWTWYLLSRHPAVDAALAAELRGVLGGRPPAAADLPRLRYAERVVLESLRLYPPAYSIGREARRTCEIGGHRVAAGTILLMSQWVVHRDPRFFERPELFDPDRWADGLAQRLPRFAYFPFGGGPRRCIGADFAVTEALLVLATIAQQFRLTPVPGHAVTPKPMVTLQLANGLPMVLHRR